MRPKSPYNFGTQVAVGMTFGDGGRYELAALIHHVSNGGLNENNYGLTYGGIRLRVGLEQQRAPRHNDKAPPKRGFAVAAGRDARSRNEASGRGARAQTVH